MLLLGSAVKAAVGLARRHQDADRLRIFLGALLVLSVVRSMLSSEDVILGRTESVFFGALYFAARRYIARAYREDAGRSRAR